MESTVLGLDFSEIGYLLLPSSLEIVQTIGHLRKAPRHRSFTETADCLDDFETSFQVINTTNQPTDLGLRHRNYPLIVSSNSIGPMRARGLSRECVLRIPSVS